MNDKFHYVNCTKCGERLCVETDTYRYDENGQPICYDCAAEE